MQRSSRLSSLSVCLSLVRSRKLSEIDAEFRRLYRKSGSPSKNMTSDSAPEVAKYSVRAYRFAPLAMQLVCPAPRDVEWCCAAPNVAAIQRIRCERPMSRSLHASQQSETPATHRRRRHPIGRPTVTGARNVTYPTKPFLPGRIRAPIISRQSPRATRAC